jgi:hypothetical protein
MASRWDKIARLGSYCKRLSFEHIITSEYWLTHMSVLSTLGHPQTCWALVCHSAIGHAFNGRVHADMLMVRGAYRFGTLPLNGARQCLGDVPNFAEGDGWADLIGCC